MPDHDVRLTVEWAVWGYEPVSARHGVLSCSQARFTAVDFAEVIHRYGSGTPLELPQVTIGWIRQRRTFHLALAIQERSAQLDRHGRATAVTRLFCIPYSQLALQPVSYEALFDAFAGLEPPGKGHLSVPVAAPEPAEIAARVDAHAVRTAALLLTGSPISIVDAGAVPMPERLRYLDTVAWLLPYGLRARLSVSTWAGSTTEHQIRLSFTDYAPRTAREVRWEERPAVPRASPGSARILGDSADSTDPVGSATAPDQEESEDDGNSAGSTARRYVTILEQAAGPAGVTGLTGLIGELAKASRPLSFRDTDDILTVLQDAVKAVSAARPATSGPPKGSPATPPRPEPPSTEPPSTRPRPAGPKAAGQRAVERKATGPPPGRPNPFDMRWDLSEPGRPARSSGPDRDPDPDQDRASDQDRGQASGPGPHEYGEPEGGRPATSSGLPPNLRAVLAGCAVSLALALVLTVSAVVKLL